MSSYCGLCSTIDSIIDLEWTRKRMPDTKDVFFANRMISLMSVIEFLISQYLLGNFIRLSGHLVRISLLLKRAGKKKPAEAGFSGITQV